MPVFSEIEVREIEGKKAVTADEGLTAGLVGQL
jgi:hypothetical protein